ncbi:hypothetical protein ACFX11_002724 [Malus domestica]
MTSSAAHGSSPVAEKLVIDLTSPKRVNKTVEPEPMKSATPKVTTYIIERLAQRKGSVVPPVSGFVSKCPSGAKSELAFERLASMKSENVDSAAKVAPGPTHHSVVIDSSIEKGKSARTGS